MIAGSQTIADDRRRSQKIEHGSIFCDRLVLSSAIAGSQAIPGDRRSVFPYDRRRSQNFLRSAICDRLTRRALLVCNSHDSLADERKYLDNVFSKNNYNCDFVTRNTYRTEPNETNTNLTPTTTVTIPYIKGTSEIIARILQPYNIRVAHRPITTLRKLLTNVKDKDQPRDRQGAVYKIKCCDCQATYIGETGRNLNTRLTEHRRATWNGDINNNIAEHHLQTNHRIDWDSATCVTYNTNYYQRIVLESWFTNLEQTPINRCLQLPAPYKRLIDDINRQTTH